MNKQRIFDHLLKLCAVPSISASDGERAMPDTIRELLMEHAYFQKHPDFIDVYTIPGDAKKGRYLFARYECERKTKKTILLLSHFDVVAIDEYGAGKPYAFDPIAYGDFLKKGEVHLDAESQEDLDSGHYLFGRGVCDMKWGLAADMEVLYHFAEHPDEAEANILLVSVPDEERNSMGMLAAVPQLLAYQKEHCLKIEHCIVSEPDISPDKCMDGKRMFIGAAGKIMPLFYCVGKETHVGDPYFGLNPNSLCSAIVERMELDPNFIDTARGYETPAPTCLKQSDCKDNYSVQTPYDAYCYFNLMTLSKTPDVIMQELIDLAKAAFASVLENRSKYHRAALEKIGKHIPNSDFTVKVMTYQELYQRCEQLHGQTFITHMQTFMKQLEKADLRKMSLAVVQEAYTFLDDRDPKIILSFTPPYYPHSGFLPEDAAMRCACERIIQDGEAIQETYHINDCFNGLTDMSYLSLREPVDIDSLAKNFPLWGSHYEVPLQDIRDLNIDFVNFGPLGKDPHKYTERIDLDYSMDKAPAILLKLVQYLSES